MAQTFISKVLLYNVTVEEQIRYDTTNSVQNIMLTLDRSSTKVVVAVLGLAGVQQLIASLEYVHIVCIH